MKNNFAISYNQRNSNIKIFISQLIEVVDDSGVE